MNCKKCGKEIPENSKFCSHCGQSQEEMNTEQPNQDQTQSQPQSNGSSQTTNQKVILAHRGTMTLVFGILGIATLFCCCPGIFSIIAIVIGTGDLKKMKMGFMDPSGKETTKIGIILGIVGLALMVIIIIGFTIFSIINGIPEYQKFNQFRGLIR